MRWCLFLMMFLASVAVSGQTINGNVKAKNLQIGNNNKMYVYVKNIYNYPPVKEAGISVPLKKKTGALSVLVIPREDPNTDIYAAFSDPVNKVAIAKITELFMENGFSVVPYPDKSSVVRQKTPYSNLNDKSKAIYLSGADICIEAELLKMHDGETHAINVILSAYDRNNGNLLAKKSEVSNYYYSTLYNEMMESMLPGLMEEFIAQMKKAIAS